MSHGPSRLEPAEAAYVESYRKDWQRPDHIEARARGRDILFRESRAVQACVSVGACHVLDVGCNDGNFALAALRAGLAPTLMDLDPGIIESARANLAKHGFNPPPAITGLVEHLGSEHGKYDAVVCMEVVEHLPNPAGAVRRMKDRARRLLVLTTPVGNCYDDPLHLHHWKDEDELSAGLGLDGQFRSCVIERIPSREGDLERVFFVTAEV